MEQVDCIVVGAGVVGLAAARALARAGDEVLVAEAAAGIGTGISSRNSEVIHAGIHYAPGSLKARLCVAGRDALYAYCAERGIGHQRLGKLIVATTQREVGELERLVARARANGVEDLAWLSGGEVLGLEPEVRCLRALLSPRTGIVDSQAFMLALQADLEAAGGTVALNAAVTGARPVPDGFEVDVAGQPALRCRRLVNAAGLAATTLARAIEGLAAARVPRLWFAAGQYFGLAGPAPFRRLVYPVPGTAGLGIHLTLDLDGRARFGPDARWVERVDFGFDGSLRDSFADAIRRYYPALDPGRLQPAYAGVRPKLAGPGEPAADFVIQGPTAHGLPGLVNLFGIESPGLTASLAIGARVADELRGSASPAWRST